MSRRRATTGRQDNEAKERQELTKLLTAPPKPTGQRRPPRRRRCIGLVGVSNAVDVSVRLSRRFAAFKGLSTHPLFEQIQGRLVAGQSAYRIARWVQQMVEPSDPFGPDVMKVEVLERKLYRFRAVMPPQAILDPNYIDTLTKGVQLQMDVADELASLVHYQKQRISQFADNEKNFPLGITAEQQRKEVVTLKELLLALRDTQVVLGLVPGTLPSTVQLSQTNINVDQYGGDMFPSDPLSSFLAQHPDAIPDVMAALDVVGQRFLNLGATVVEGESVEVVHDESG